MKFLYSSMIMVLAIVAGACGNMTEKAGSGECATGQCKNVTQVDAGSTADTGNTNVVDNDAGQTGTQDAGSVSTVDTYKCVPQCGAKECGDDGCGGKCGTCGTGKICSAAGACVVMPTQDAGQLDSGSTDAGSTDAGSAQVDAGTPDAGTPDVGQPDAGSVNKCVNVNCDDGNVCTDDSCDPATGCKHASNNAVCASDGNPATIDKCTGGTCVHVVEPLLCNDSDPCTDDLVQNGSCWHPPKDCSDNDASTVDKCVAGTCVHEALPSPTPGWRKVCITTTSPTIKDVVGDEWKGDWNQPNGLKPYTSHNWGDFESIPFAGGKKWCRVVTDQTMKAVRFLIKDISGNSWPGYVGQNETPDNIKFYATVQAVSSNIDGTVVYDNETVQDLAVKGWVCPGNDPIATPSFGVCYWHAGNGEDYGMMVPLVCTNFGGVGC